MFRCFLHIHHFLLRLRRAGFTHVLDLDNTERTALITRATGAPCRVAIWYVRHAWPWVYTAALQSQPAEHERRSIIEYYLSALGPAGVPVTSREVRLVPREADLVSARLLVRNAGRKILLHPGSRSAFRMWPAANFAAVCDRVQDELGAQVFVLGGPGEQDTVNAIRAAAKSHLVTINTALGLAQFAALAAQFDLMLLSGPKLVDEMVRQHHLSASVLNQSAGFLIHPFDLPGFAILISGIAVVIGLGMVNLLQPGRGVGPALAQSLLEQGRAGAANIVENAPTSISLGDFFLDLVPSNVFTAAAENAILPVMVFALFFGIGLVMARSPATDRLQEVIQGLFEVTMKLINLFIKLAPLAIACLMFNLAALFGVELLIRLAAYVGVAVGAMAIHMFVVYPLVVWLLGGMSPIAFFRGVREPMIVAFSTASSNASLTFSLRAAEEQLHLPRKIARFVLTVGATANQNGTALFEGVTVLFLAQFFGIDLTLTQQLIVMLVCILGGVGTAGVPAGSLPVVAMILVMVGVPAEGIGLILGVDRFLDMCRTTLNVTAGAVKG